METRKSGICYYKLCTIPILPMRHGNISSNWSRRLSSEIPILPMRHGNFLAAFAVGLTLDHSDPTYEAWKLLNSLDMLKEFAWFRSYLWGMETDYSPHPTKISSSHSDPTYEAWKLVSIHPFNFFKWAYSDPTYEAWKPDMDIREHLFCCPFRSYLWGMET